MSSLMGGGEVLRKSGVSFAAAYGTAKFSRSEREIDFRGILANLSNSPFNQGVGHSLTLSGTTTSTPKTTWQRQATKIETKTFWTISCERDGRFSVRLQNSLSQLAPDLRRWLEADFEFVLGVPMLNLAGFNLHGGICASTLISHRQFS